MKLFITPSGEKHPTPLYIAVRDASMILLETHSLIGQIFGAAFKETVTAADIAATVRAVIATADSPDSTLRRRFGEMEFAPADVELLIADVVSAYQSKHSQEEAV